MTMAKAFTVSAEPEIEFVRTVAKKRGFNESREDYNSRDTCFTVRGVVLVRLESVASTSDRNPPVGFARNRPEIPAKDASIVHIGMLTEFGNCGL